MDVHIRRLSSHYRVPASQRGAAPRLDAIAAELLGDALSAAAARDGSAGKDEQICVRRARVALRVRASDSDADIAARWGDTAAAALREAVEEGDPSNVVRYASRAHALADLAFGAASGDLARCWAWRQVGLWRGPVSESAGAARAELFGALAAHPTAIVPVLAALARRGALRALAAAWSAEHFGALAAAALRAAGADERVLAGPEAGPAQGREREATRADAAPAREAPAASLGAAAPGAAAATPGDVDLARPADEPLERPATSDLRARAARSLAASALGAFAADARSLPAASLRPLAVLALLEVEPSALRAGNAAGEGLARAMLDVLREARGEAPRSVEYNSYSKTAPPDRRPAPARPPVPGPARGSTPPARSPRGAEPSAAAPASPPRGASPRASLNEPSGETGDAAVPRGAPAARDTERAGRTGRADRAHRDEPADPAAAPARSPTFEPADDPWTFDRRARGTTRAGGLLFLLHIVGELGLADALADSPALAARPLRWSLHQLAMAAGEVSADDPAALAFAGLGPDAEPPSEGEEPVTAPEHEAIARAASLLVARLAERLAPPGAAAPPPGVDPRAKERELVLRVTRRRAEILADPGWFEVRLALEEVTTDVRRAGLDLDLDHVPWLGVVVRFTYA